MAHHNNEHILTLNEITDVVSIQSDTTTGDNLIDITFRLRPDVKIIDPQGIFLGNDVTPRFLSLPQPAEETQEEATKNKKGKKAAEVASTPETNGGTN